jgi:hypothetical protein
MAWQNAEVGCLRVLKLRGCTTSVFVGFLDEAGPFELGHAHYGLSLTLVSIQVIIKHGHLSSRKLFLSEMCECFFLFELIK